MILVIRHKRQGDSRSVHLRVLQPQKVHVRVSFVY